MGRLGLLVLIGFSLTGLRLDAGEVDGSLAFKGDAVAPQAAFLAALLSKGRDGAAPVGSVGFELPAALDQGRYADGRWVGPALQAALASQGRLAFHGDAARAGAAAPAAAWGPMRPSSGLRITASGLPRLLLLENSATISPLSKGLQAWGWPYTLKTFADAEADPRGLFDAQKQDLVVVESPAGWGGGDEPSGPSQMDDAVAAALRDYVRRGGSAVFVDISQWDVEKAWPRSIGLEPVGPYAVSKLKFFQGPRGGLSLSNFGEVADTLQRADAFTLVGSKAFDFADGSVGPVYAAWAMSDPGGGQGWVAGLAFHVFDQDDSDSLSVAGQRLLLNLFLLSGAGRISVQGEAPPATPSPASAPPLMPLPTAMPTVPPPASTFPSPTAWPSQSLPTAAATFPPPAPPTAMPTFPPPTSTPMPAPPTAVPTLPPPTPLQEPLAPTALPTVPAPTPWPTPLPPTAAPAPPTTTPWPTPVAPMSVQAPALPAPPAAPVFSVPSQPALPAPMPLATLPPPTPMPAYLPPTPVPALPAPNAALVASPLTPSAPAPPAYARKRVLRRHRRRALGRRTEPLPTPQPTVVMRQSIQNALGCLASAPEPFSDGGVYIEFCLTHTANVRIEVFDASGMKLWGSEMRLLQPGQQQWWFEGMVQGRPLAPGSYLYEITADYGDGMSENRQGSMTRGEDRQ